MSFATMAFCIVRSSSTSHVAERKRPLNHIVSFGDLVSHTRNPPHRPGSSVKSAYRIESVIRFHGHESELDWNT